MNARQGTNVTWTWGNLGRLAIAIALACGGLIVAGPSQARAAGLLVADGGFGGVLEIESHEAVVTINNGVAVTEVKQVFRNTEDRQVEALYTFPVPKGASVANFSMWIGGKEMVGEVVEKKRAREIYESYKQTRRDPGLLEQTDYKTFEMRIFPIGPRAEQTVKIRYYQEVDCDNDWVTYVYPLSTSSDGRADSRTTGTFSLALHARSNVPIVAMESPSHKKNFAIVKHNAAYYEAGLEISGGSLGRDVVLAYKLSRPTTGVDLIASSERGDDGYFCMTLTAGEELAANDAAMDYLFVLDVSGSMADESKLAISRNCIEAFIDKLAGEDRFEVITFNMRPTMLFRKLTGADAAAKKKASDFLASQSAGGGTVLRGALQTAYKYRDVDRPLNVVVLSDGMTEQGSRAQLLEAIASRPSNIKVFCVGVGNDVNRPLLTQIARDAGGLAAFLSRGDNFDRQAKAFRRKLTRPALTDVKIAIDGGQVYDVEPQRLPNLYHGAPVRMYGRYRRSGKANVVVTAEINGKAYRKTVAVSLPAAEGDNPEIMRMWAWHRVGALMKTGPDGPASQAIEEIVRLGEGYSIATQYTSFIVLENDAEYERWRIKRRNSLLVSRDRKARQKLMADLETMRDQSLAALGPQGAKGPTARNDAKAARTPQQSPAWSNPGPSRPPMRGPSSGGGGGPVGPAGLAVVAVLVGARILRRRKDRTCRRK